MAPWRRRHPIVAGLVVGVGAYAFFAFTLTTFGDAAIEQALGAPTVLGAALMWFIAWAVFSRSDERRRIQGPIEGAPEAEAAHDDAEAPELGYRRTEPDGDEHEQGQAGAD